MNLKAIIQTSRPSFLLLTPICVFLGYALASQENPSINFAVFSLIVVTATLAHISVNMLNEYEDFSSGLDFITQKTPFSGGSGSLPANPDQANIVGKLAMLTLGITIILGCYLALQFSPTALIFGIIGVLLIVSYSKWLNRIPALCLIAPGFAFGPIMVIGTQLILTDSLSQNSFLVSLIPFFLVNNLLLLNQYPDILADKKIGRRTPPIVYGTAITNTIYALFGVIAFLIIAYQIHTGSLPFASVISLITLPFAVIALAGAILHGTGIGDHPKFMAMNVITALLTPLLLAISILSK